MNAVNNISVSVLLGAFLLAPVVCSAGDLPEAGKVCTDCHHETGVSDDPEIPTIAGASSFFLENQLAVFSEEARPCEAHIFDKKSQELGQELPAADHCALAKDIADEDKTAIADYFAAKPFVAADQEFDASMAEKGKSIHEANCERCHTEGGSLALDDAGILAGQWKPYLMEQLEHYKAEKRWQPEKMQPETAKLSDEDMKALVEFYASEGKGSD